MKQKIFCLLMLCIVILSCSDSNDPIEKIENNDPFISLNKTNVDFTNEGGSEGILIESNVTWAIKSSASWCSVTPSSGNNSTTSITLSAPANKDYDHRSCTVTIQGGDITKIITINQSENLGLLLAQDSYELSHEESIIQVEVETNVEFEVVINDDWITQVETRGLSTTELMFTIAENTSREIRSAVVYIKSKTSDLLETVTIVQNALTMADILENEKLIINQFFEKNNLIILDKYPENNVFKSNEFFFDASSGIYYNVIDAGDSRRIMQGEELYIRFKGLRYISSNDTTAYSNMSSLQPEILVYGNPSTYTSAGWVVPLKNVGDRAKIKLIVPFKMGLPQDQQEYKTAYYEELFYRFEQ